MANKKCLTLFTELSNLFVVAFFSWNLTFMIITAAITLFFIDFPNLSPIHLHCSSETLDSLPQWNSYVEQVSSFENNIWQGKIWVSNSTWLMRILLFDRCYGIAKGREISNTSQLLFAKQPAKTRFSSTAAFTYFDSH